MASHNTVEWYLNRAKELYEREGEIEIDLNPPPKLNVPDMVSMNDAEGYDHGAYVMAWVWVDDDEGDWCCPTCRSDDKEVRLLGCNGQFGVLHDACGTELCPDKWHE